MRLCQPTSPQPAARSPQLNAASTIRRTGFATRRTAKSTCKNGNFNSRNKPLNAAQPHGPCTRSPIEKKKPGVSFSTSSQFFASIFRYHHLIFRFAFSLRFFAIIASHFHFDFSLRFFAITASLYRFDFSPSPPHFSLRFFASLFCFAFLLQFFAITASFFASIFHLHQPLFSPACVRLHTLLCLHVMS